MITALWLLAVQGAFGAFDTVYYHEWRARLPALPGARPELRLHAAVGLAGKVLGPLGLARLIWSGAWPPSSVVLCLTNDLVWWLPFSLYLYDAWPYFRVGLSRGGDDYPKR